MQFCPGNLVEHTPLPMTIVFEGEEPPALGLIAGMILTFAPPAGLTNGATLSGSGWISTRGFDGITNNERVVGSYEFHFSGKTGTINDITHTPPTWAAAS